MIWWDDREFAVADPDQVVLEADPPRRLSYTWHTFTPEWVGTSMWFDLRPRGDASTAIEFRHVGLLPSCSCYGECSGGWDHYIKRSLPEYAAGRSGAPRGSTEWVDARSRPETVGSPT